MKIIRSLFIFFAFFLGAFYLSHFQAIAGEVTGGLTTPSTTDAAYKNIGVTGHTNLDVFKTNDKDGNGSIEGVVLECSRNEDGKVGFCSNTNCTNSKTPGAGIKISREFAEFIDNYSYRCFKEIMDTKEYNCSGGLAICVVYGHSKRNARNKGDTGVPSRHSTGDAMDISGDLYCGQTKLVTFTQGGRSASPKAQKVYDHFTTCWEKEVQRAIQDDARRPLTQRKYMMAGGCIGCQGSKLKSQNSGHNDHIHVSGPVLRPGRISTK